jgi:hypothetical protein
VTFSVAVRGIGAFGGGSGVAIAYFIRTATPASATSTARRARRPLRRCIRRE